MRILPVIARQILWKYQRGYDSGRDSLSPARRSNGIMTHNCQASVSSSVERPAATFSVTTSQGSG